MRPSKLFVEIYSHGSTVVIAHTRRMHNCVDADGESVSIL